MKRLSVPILIIAALALGAWFLRPARGGKMTVWLTGDVRGRLVPCGCFTGQFGGLTRVATLLAATPRDMSLRLDAGDALEGPEDFQAIELEYIHAAFARMGFDALNLGHREASLDSAQLRSIIAKSTVPVVSANLFDSAGLIAKPFTVVKKHGLRIGIAGVMDERTSPATGLRVEKMSTVIGQLLPMLKRDADTLVLLAFTDQERLRTLAAEFPEFSLVLGGKVSQPSQQLERAGDTAILYVTNESKALGQLHGTLAPEGRLRLTAGEVQLVTHHVAEDATIEKLAHEYRDHIRRTKLAVDDSSRASPDAIPGVRTAATFVGSEACAGCHEAATKKWKATAHSRAFHTLRSRKADADPNCIGCHTIGFREPSGYLREFGEKKLTDVGCESCHGPGSRHIERITAGDLAGAKLRELGANDCVKCHHGEFSRPFSYSEFWHAIEHGK